MFKCFAIVAWSRRSVSPTSVYTKRKALHFDVPYGSIAQYLLVPQSCFDVYQSVRVNT